MVDDDRTGPGATGEPQVPTPPYSRGEPTGEGAESVRKAFDADNAAAPGPPPPASEEERNGVSATDTAPEPALGVGESRGGRAEDLAPERDDVKTKGASQRPAGRADEDDTNSVGESGPKDPDMPDLQAGDQGG